ncbi:MAG: tetratricopeptide repeat protein, partial [Planctomycetota bacterium]|nr:tetratricopeptide repeat protein [Planctomycetota bacterium]
MSRSFSPLLGGVLFCAAFSLYCLAQGTGLAPDPLKQALEQADQAMRDRDYGAAARAYARVKADFAGTEGSHRAAYMRLRAFYFDKRYRDVLSEGAAYLRDAPEGSFADKVRYLMANAYQRTRGWGDASRLLQERAEFLAGDGYRERLSKLFLEQADSAFEGEEKKDEFGRPARKPDYPLALDLYKRARAIRVPPERAAEVDFRMAECLAQTDAGALAAPAYAQLLKDHPDSDLHAESLLRAGRHYMEWDPKTARELLDRVRKEFPDTPQAPLALLALADGLTNEPGKVRDEGLQLYRIFLERHPDHEQAPHAAFRRAEVLQRDREYAQAEPRWRDFLRRFPGHDKAPQARIQLAGGLLAVHRYDDAIAAWHAYLTAHPNDPNWEQARQAIPATFLSKAGHLLDKKEYGAAVEVYRAFLKEYPDHGQAAAVHLAIADAFDKAKNAESKLAMLDVCAQKYRGRREAAQALFATARHHDEHGDLTKAIEGYEKTAKEYAKFPEGRQARIILDTLRQKTLTIRAERIFSTTEAANLEVETRNIPKLQTRLYRVDLAEYFRKKKQVTGIENLAVDVVKPDLDGVIDLGERYERFRLFSGAHKLPVKQGEPGAYVVVVGEDDLTATTLIVVSDLRLVVKSSRGHLFCWAFRASDHAPWPGVRIAAAAGGQILEAKTGPDGTASIAHQKLGSGAQVMAEADGHYAFSNGAVGATAASGYKPVGYVFTDRPLYRPGETVKIGAFLRHTSKGVYTIPKNHEVELWVTDKNSVELVRRKLHTDDFGVLETEVVLDGEAPLGKARVHIRDGKRTFTGEFSIAEFRKPEFTVQLEADTLALRPGETIKVRAAARYLVGGPVSKAPLQWRLVRLPFAFDRSRYDSFAWFFESKRSKRDRAPSGAEVVERGTLTAGEDGTAQIEVETDEEAGDAVYVFELEATDVDRLSASARLDFFATRQDHFAVVDIDRKAVRPGEDFRVRVRTVDASHRPVSRSGKLIVARRELDARNSWTFVPVRTLEVSTSREGRAELSVQLPQGGRYEIRYESGALGPRRVTASAAMTATGEDFQKERDVRVVVDRRYYLEGEKARIFIDSPITGTPALLTFEAGRVLRHEFVQLKNSATVLEIPLTELYAPNVFVSIAVPGAHELKTASDEIVVFRYLDVRVRPQAPTGGPGEEVRFDIETVDALGRPVAASVALSLVDEALYMLENDPARGIRKRYYDVRRTHVVQTHSSFGFKYAGFTRPTNKDLLAEVQRKTGGPSAEDRAKEHV